MKFKELREAEGEFIRPYRPSPASTGRPRADDRKTINGILYVSITGCKWVDMPHTRLRSSGNRMETVQELAGEGRMERNRTAAER
jgi:transposase